MAHRLGGPITMQNPFLVRGFGPMGPMPNLSFPNPNPRVSPAGLSGTFNANNAGWDASLRQTFGGINRSVFVQGMAQGAWGGKPAFGGMVGGMIRF